MAAPLIPIDRVLSYAELSALLRRLARRAPDLVAVSSIGKSYEGRDLWLATVTDRRAGEAADKPAHWVDANIHATELCGGVAALALLRRLVEGHATGDERVVEALRTRTFYVVPRVNPDGVEAAIGPQPRYLRSSVRPWPWRDGRRWPGLVASDLDGDGAIRTVRVADPDGAWTPHPDDDRVMVPVPLDGVCAGHRYRCLAEGRIEGYDGFTIPTPRDVAGLDLNRNFPAGWSPTTTGAGDRPGSEPEIDALLRAITERPNVCGYNAYHTAGGVLLRPSSTQADSTLPRVDVWTWTELAKVGTELTGYPAHSVYEDFTWDRSQLMAGASDDWAYEHLGVYSWTTEFWDVVHAATGEHAATDIWWMGPTPSQELAVARWADAEARDAGYRPFEPFDHPDLGPVELGGCDEVRLWSNPPPSRLAEEVSGHADFAIAQALAAPALAIRHLSARPLADGAWRVDAGIANTGWLPTNVTARAAQQHLVLPIVAELSVPDGEVVGEARHPLGQLAGRADIRRDGGARNDGTPDRALATWVVRARRGTVVELTATHPRAGTARANLTLRRPR
jgi:murein tripeptide amidase MpaA